MKHKVSRTKDNRTAGVGRDEQLLERDHGSDRALFLSMDTPEAPEEAASDRPCAWAADAHHVVP